MEGGGEEGNTPLAAALEEPMDTEDGGDLVGDGTDDDRRPLSRVLDSGSQMVQRESEKQYFHTSVTL